MSSATAQLNSHAQALVGKRCWGIIAGAGTGSTVHLQLGAYISRARPITNQRLTEAEREYEGECDLFIECAWRLEEGASVLCGSTDADRNDGPMVKGLSRLRDKTVQVVEVFDPIPDLTVRFDGDLSLKIFCDQTDVEHHSDNYSLRLGDLFVVVGTRGRIEFEER